MILLRYALAALFACALPSLALAGGTSATYGNASAGNSTAMSASSSASASSALGNGYGGQGGSVTTNDVRQAPGVSAPSLSTSGETCMGSTSAGASGAGFGLSFGTTWDSAECQRRMNSQQLRLLGQHDAALALLCQNPGVADALQAVGKRCPGATQAPVALAPAAPASDYCARNPGDYYCRPSK